MVWFTPIVYAVDVLPKWAADLLWFNPAFAFLHSLHELMFYRRQPDPALFGLMIFWTALALGFGFFVYRKTNKTLRDICDRDFSTSQRVFSFSKSCRIGKTCLWFISRRSRLRQGRFPKSISLNVPKGQIHGIIGMNGAGKSTLLKILTGVILPTSGSFKLEGRVAALLELGTGFHSELTGRQNVYLNASIMGLSRSEVESKIEGIQSFSELGAFFDRPVKNLLFGNVCSPSLCLCRVGRPRRFNYR